MNEYAVNCDFLARVAKAVTHPQYRQMAEGMLVCYQNTGALQPKQVAATLINAMKTRIALPDTALFADVDEAPKMKMKIVPDPLVESPHSASFLELAEAHLKLAETYRKLADTM